MSGPNKRTVSKRDDRKFEARARAQPGPASWETPSGRSSTAPARSWRTTVVANWRSAA